MAHPELRAGDDLELVVMRYAAALEEANANLGASRVCKAALRERLARRLATRAALQGAAR